MSLPYYDSDLTDEEWQRIEPLLPPAKPVGKDREVDLRDVLNAIFIVRTTEANGAPCQVIFLPGKRCMGTSDCGCGWVYGSRLTWLW